MTDQPPPPTTDGPTTGGPTTGGPTTGGTVAEGAAAAGPLALGKGTVGEVLDIETVEATPDRVVLRLPVTWKVHQPYGILHGGVSALLAESAASFGAAVSVPPGYKVVGIELNVSHLRAMTDGTLTAVATPIRKGRTVHVWDVALSDDRGRDICRGRCTLSVIPPG